MMSQRIMSLGKFSALQHASTRDGHFTILALDHQDALKRALNAASPESVTPDQIIQFKAQVIRTLAPLCSGVLLDPVYGAPQAIQGGYLSGVGLLVELEKADYQLRPMPLECELLPDWTPAKIKRMGADGVKLFFYYNPDEATLTVKQDLLIRRVAAECDLQDIPFYAEPIVCAIGENEAEYKRHYSHRVVESARRVAPLGVDILKMEYPVMPDSLQDRVSGQAACAEITSSVDIPWVLLSAGVEFEKFCEQVEVACSAGASGFIAGRAVWGEAAAISGEGERQSWLETAGRERLRQLAGCASRGRPWDSVLACEPVSTGWYRTYGET